MKKNKKEDMKAIENYCIDENCCKNVNRQLKELSISPFEECISDDLRRLFSFFLHQAPNIESLHFLKIPKDLHEALILRMFEERNYKYKEFCASNVRIETKLEKMGLNGDKICFLCKRFVCKKKKPEKSKPRETELECFLRHIRNAIAHGRVYLFHGGNKIDILFEDVNATKKISARIHYWKQLRTHC